MAALPVQEILTGLSIGSRYFLLALGLSLIFGVLGILNFAHGVIYMLGSYILLSISQNITGNFWIALLITTVVVGLIGVAIEMSIIRRVYDRSELDHLIATFALVLIVTDLTRTIWGSSTQTVSTPPVLTTNINVLGTSYPSYRLFVIVVGFIAMGVFWYIVQRTYFGQLVRATASDRDMAAMLGVNVPRLYTGVFGVGCMLAGVGGGITAPLQAFTPALGEQVIINAFIVVVIGGLGSFVGAFVGAIFIGLLESFGVLVTSGAGQLLPFLLMIAVLIFRPKGIFGGGEE